MKQDAFSFRLPESAGGRFRDICEEAGVTVSNAIRALVFAVLQKRLALQPCNLVILGAPLDREPPGDDGLSQRLLPGVASNGGVVSLPPVPDVPAIAEAVQTAKNRTKTPAIAGKKTSKNISHGKRRKM